MNDSSLAIHCHPLLTLSWQFLPGYHRFVPPGQSMSFRGQDSKIDEPAD
jgi:hypothetical protein